MVQSRQAGKSERVRAEAFGRDGRVPGDWDGNDSHCNGDAGFDRGSAGVESADGPPGRTPEQGATAQRDLSGDLLRFADGGDIPAATGQSDQTGSKRRERATETATAAGYSLRDRDQQGVRAVAKDVERVRGTIRGRK